MVMNSQSQVEQWPTLASSTRPVLLIMAYDCMPEVDGAPSTAWVRVLEASREFEVHAIVGPDSLRAIEQYGRDGAAPAVSFHTPMPDRIWRALTRGRAGDRGVAAYRYWQRLAFNLAQKLHATYRFALVHQLNPANVSEPGYGWKLGIPFVWGPAGGTEILPPEFLGGLPLTQQIAERGRELSTRLALRSGRVRRAAANAAVLLAPSTQVQRDFERVFRRPVELLPETGIPSVERAKTARFRFGGPLNLLWAGELARPGGLPLLLEAVANLGHDVDYHLHILGTGPLEAEWKSLAAEMGVRRRCTFHGSATREDLIARLDWAHLFVFTNLRDTSVAPVVEALGRGVPVMCFDHHAAGDIVTSSCGIKIPMTHPGHAIAAMASSIRQLAHERTPLLRLSAGASDRAQNYLWQEDSARLLDIYRLLAPVEVPVGQLSGGAA